MRVKDILLLTLSVVLIVCLLLVARSCVAERSMPAATPAPAATKKPVPTFAPTPKPSPTPEPTPTPEPGELAFAQERGFRFEEPAEHSIPAVQTSSLKEAKYIAVRARLSAPIITRSEEDEEGCVTWEIRYSTTADAGFIMPSNAGVDTFYLFAGGYDLIDYYTGKVLNSRDNGDLVDERTYARETTLGTGDESFTVQVTERARSTWGEWEFTEENSRTLAKNHVALDALLTVRAPADYDGLVLGLNTAAVQTIPDEFLPGDTVREENAEIWDGSTEDWIFVRADEWISDIAPEEPEVFEEEADMEEQGEEVAEESVEEEETVETEDPDAYFSEEPFEESEDDTEMPM